MPLRNEVAICIAMGVGYYFATTYAVAYAVSFEAPRLFLDLDASNLEGSLWAWALITIGSAHLILGLSFGYLVTRFLPNGSVLWATLTVISSMIFMVLIGLPSLFGIDVYPNSLFPIGVWGVVSLAPLHLSVPICAWLFSHLVPSPNQSLQQTGKN